MGKFIFLILVVVAIVVIYNVKKNKKEKEEAERRYWENERLEKERREKEAQQQEQARKSRERQEFIEKKRKEFTKVLDDIECLETEDGKFISEDDPVYQRFVSCRDEASKEIETEQIWNQQYQLLITRLDFSIKTEISNIVSHMHTYYTLVYVWSICRKLKIIKLVTHSDSYDDTIMELEKLRETLEDMMHNTWFIYSAKNEYGLFNYPVTNENGEINPERLDEEIAENDLNRIECHFAELEKLSKQEKVDFESYKSIPEFLNIEDCTDSIWAMWCFAAHKPFDVSKFERACKIVSWYLNYKGIQSLETMIVRIYNWKAMGGNDVVKEYSRDILDWVENVSDIFSDKETGEKYGSQIFYNFVSALAWMELYDLELMVLKKLVDLKVQLWEDAQDRLKFLSSGGIANVQIYTPEEGVFSFDSSAAEWKDNEISVFFRKIKMKNIVLRYSLVCKSWTKTYPLQAGQKYDEDVLYAEFKNMVEDFDGEVTLSREKAVALNMKSVRYPNAMIFRFTSERNRCTSILFHAEKFGKNLNITILTLFTPEENISTEDLEQYAIAIKNNVYAESFREAILEAVDAVLKTETKAYEDIALAEETSSEGFSGFFD